MTKLIHSDYYCEDEDPEYYLEEDIIYINLEAMLRDDFARPIVGFEDYYICRDGGVISLKSGEPRYMKWIKLKSGHFHTLLCKNGKPHFYYIHRLVAESFIPNPRNYPFVRHLDDNKANNSDDNLAWGTQKDNMDDSFKNGTFPRRKIVAVKFGKEYVFESTQEAARKLGVQQAHVSQVLNGLRKHTKGYSFYDYYEYYHERMVEYLNESRVCSGNL